MYLATKIRHMLNDRVEMEGVSINDMAERMKCTRQNASRILNEGPKTFDRLERVANALGWEVHVTITRRSE